MIHQLIHSPNSDSSDSAVAITTIRKDHESQLRADQLVASASYTTVTARFVEKTWRWSASVEPLGGTGFSSAEALRHPVSLDGGEAMGPITWWERCIPTVNHSDCQFPQLSPFLGPIAIRNHSFVDNCGWCRLMSSHVDKLMGLVTNESTIRSIDRPNF